MSETVHALVVRVGDVPCALPMSHVEQTCALPMSHVEQTFRLSSYRIHNIGGTLCVLFRGKSLPMYRVADRLGLSADEPTDAVIVWIGGRRMALAVNELIGQSDLPRTPLPALARSPFCSGALIDETGSILPILDIPSIAGVYEQAPVGFELTAMQQSALREVANIGSGQAATALSGMISDGVDLSFAEAMLVRASEATALLGSPLETSALVETPIAGGNGRVVLVFTGDAPQRLCSLLGVSLADEMGRSALREVGNILSTSYMNGIAMLTGMELEPEPPRLEVDLLGKLLERLHDDGSGDDLVVFMRSTLIIGGVEGFTFTFVPQITAVDELLERLERAMGAAA